MKKQIIIITLLGAALVQGALANEYPKGFYCKQGGAELKVVFNSGPRGTDVTKMKTPDFGKTFYTLYKHTKSPHYRWGYEDVFETVLSKAKLHIAVENQGPTYKEDGSYGYYVRGIHGYMQFPDESGMKPILFICKSLGT